MYTNIVLTLSLALTLCSIAFSFVLYQRMIRERIQHAQDIVDARAMAAKEASKNTDKQRAVIKGQLAEQFYPLTDRCGYHPSDMRFMGMPIDYIIFDGYTECKDEGGHIHEIIFAEIKSGSSQLSRHQREIRDAVTSGRVRWETINV